MARRIFVSYKYADTLVEQLPDGLNQYGTARDYVDLIMQTLAEIEIYNGEAGDNDLSQFTDETIKTHLKYLIRHSSITIVLVSKGMKDTSKSEKEQWIPWEIQYSLTRRAYGKRRSNRNGILAVLLPDENGSYDYYFEYSNCLYCNTRTHKIGNLFQMLSGNMFNLKNPTINSCPSPAHDSTYHVGNAHSYAYQVKWEDFISEPSKYIDVSEIIKQDVDSYTLKKRVTA